LLISCYVSGHPELCGSGRTPPRGCRGRRWEEDKARERENRSAGFSIRTTALEENFRRHITTTSATSSQNSLTNIRLPFPHEIPLIYCPPFCLENSMRRATKSAGLFNFLILSSRFIKFNRSCNVRNCGNRNFFSCVHRQLLLRTEDLTNFSW
jgi:hypothetical protein